MVDLIEVQSDVRTPAALRDRRRPGRRAFRGAQLVALLRGQPIPHEAGDLETPIPVDLPPDNLPENESDRDTWTAARGIGLGLVLGGALWVTALVGLWFYFSA